MSVCLQNLTNFCPYALISTPNVPSIFFTQQLYHPLPLDRFLRSIVLCFFTKNNNFECRDVLKTVTVTSGVCVCAKCDQFLPVRSHFDTKRPVNFFTATFQSATFGRPLFAFVLCVLRQKIIKKPKMLGKRIDRRNRWSAQREEMNATLYCRLITRWRHGFLL